MALGEAVNVFSKLTIGDGLVSQVPAFLISLAAGLIVTRSSSESDLGREVIQQLLGRRSVLLVSAVFLGILAFTPLPKLPLLSLAAALALGAYFLGRQVPEANEIKDEPQRRNARTSPRRACRGSDGGPAPGRPAGAGDRLSPDRVGGADARRGPARPFEDGPAPGCPRPRFDRAAGADPGRDRSRSHEYRLKIRGTAVGQGTAYAGRLLAVPPAGLVTRPDGRDGVDPVTGQPAVWIHADGREVAELAGCRIVEASAVVAGHFGEIVLSHADELMTREQVGRLLERVRATSPALVDEVVPGLLRAGELQRVLQNLLRERVSIRDLETILETLAVHAGRVKEIDVLTEHVRRGPARGITEQYKGSDGRLRVVALSRPLDARLAAAGVQSETRLTAALGADAARSIVRAVAYAVSPLIEQGSPPVVLASSEARPS